MTYLTFGLILIVAYLVIAQNLRRARRHASLRTLIEQLTVQWNVLSFDEKVELLYAFHGKELQNCFDQGREISQRRERSHDFGEESAELDGIYNWMDRIFQGCPQYEILTGFDLDVAFDRLLEDHVSQIGSNFEEGFAEIQARLEYLFSNKSKLARFFIARKNQFGRPSDPLET